MEITANDLGDKPGETKPEELNTKPTGIKDDLSGDYLVLRQAVGEFYSPAFQGIYPQLMATSIQELQQSMVNRSTNARNEENVKPMDDQSTGARGEIPIEQATKQYAGQDLQATDRAVKGEVDWTKAQGPVTKQSVAGLQEPPEGNPVETIAAIATGGTYLGVKAGVQAGAYAGKTALGMLSEAAPTIARAMSSGVLGAAIDIPAFAGAQALELQSSPVLNTLVTLAVGGVGGAVAQGAIEGLAGKVLASMPLEKTAESLARVKGAIEAAYKGDFSDPFAKIVHESMAKLIQDESGLIIGGSPKNIDLTKFARAKQMAEKGVPAEEMRLATGFFQDKQGNWRWEISDKNYTLDLKAIPLYESPFKSIPSLNEKGLVKLPEVVSHPELFKEIPELKDTKVAFLENDRIPGFGIYDKRTDTIFLNKELMEIDQPQIKRTMLHEIDHVIAEKRGLTQGGTPTKMAEQFPERYSLNLQEVQKLRPDAPPDEIAATAAYQTYRDLAGEANARDAVSRWVMGENERAVNFPKALESWTEAESLFNSGAFQKEASKYADLETVLSQPAHKRYFEVVDQLKEMGFDLNNKMVRDAFATKDYELLSPSPAILKNALQLIWKDNPAQLERAAAQIDAFHGSPYKFDKFKSEKIGTGEGNTSFGHGLYFTSEKDVAKHYGKMFELDGELIPESTVLKLPPGSVGELSKQGRLKEVENIYSVTLHKGKQPGEYDYLSHDKPLSEQKGIVDKLSKPTFPEGIPNSISASSDLLGDTVKGKAFISKGYGGLDIPTQKSVSKAVVASVQDPQILDSIIKSIPVDVMNLFKREQLTPEILLHDEAMLHNWLVSHSDKSVAIGTDSASSFVNSIAKAATEYVGKSGIKSLALEPLSAISAGKGKHGVSPSMSHSIYQYAKENQDINGQELYKYISQKLGSDREASAFLLRSGIDGIEYPAGSLSGATGKGRNYVVFDENAITINKGDTKALDYAADIQKAVKPPTKREKILSDILGKDPLEMRQAAPAPEKPTVTVLAKHPIQEVPVDSLKLSEQVPNFKEGANKQGVVEPLQGKFERLGTGPIVVWQRLNGDLEVITGRHRLDLAKRSGDKTIPAQIVKESEGFTDTQAIMLDSESNIRDNQGSVKDYANYFRNGKIGLPEASSRGLLAREKGRNGFSIGNDASDNLYTGYRAGRISEAKTLAISEAAPKNEDLQTLGIKYAQTHNAEDTQNYLKAIQTIVPESTANQINMFGANESWQVEADKMAKSASKMIYALDQEKSALRAAGKLGKDKFKDFIEKYGINPGNPDAIEARIAEVDKELFRMRKWPTDHELVSKIREDAGLKANVEALAADMTLEDYLKKPKGNKVLDKILAPEGPLEKEVTFDPKSLDLPFQDQTTMAKAANINLAHVSDEAGIQDALVQTSEVFADEIDAIRRGWRSNKVTEAKALKEETLKLSELIGRPIGAAFNAEEAVRARFLLVSSANNLVNKAKTAALPIASPLEKLEFQKMLNTHYAVQMQVSGMTAEAGRALQSFRIMAKSDKEMMKALEDIAMAQGVTGKGSIEELARRIAALDDPQAVNKAVMASKQAGNYDMFIEAWINGLLSGPTTHVVNMVSNALVAFWQIPERIIAAGISKIPKVGSGDIHIGEALEQSYGMVEGLKDGLKMFGKYMRTESGADVFNKTETYGHAITADNIRNSFPMKHMPTNILEEGGVPARMADFLGSAIRVPTRFLGAEDEFFKAVGYRMELRAQAFRMARKEGLEGDVLAARMTEILSDPQQFAPDVHMAAIDAARYQTFTNSLGKSGAAIQNVTNSVPGLKVIIPFFRTPTNIVKYTLQRTPLPMLVNGAVRADIAAGGARRDMALARMATGSSVMAVMGYAAAQGLITGGGPSDPKLQANLKRQGWQPYSLKLGDKYYSYKRIEPLGTLFGLVADFAEISGMAGEEMAPEIEHLATSIAAALSKDVTSKTWMEGVSSAIEALDDPDKAGPRFIRNFMGSLVPTASATLERTIDPDKSDVQSIVDAMKARIPGLSKTLPVSRDLWGEKISYMIDPKGKRSFLEIASSIANPIYISKEQKSPIDKELSRLKIGLEKPNRAQRFKGVDIQLNPNEYERFVVIMNEVDVKGGMNLKESLNDLVTKNDAYKDAEAEKKEDMIREMKNFAVGKARMKLYQDSPELQNIIDTELMNRR